MNITMEQARRLPVILAELEQVSPDLARQLTAKPLLASKTPWGTLLAGVVAWASAKYGLGLDADATNLVAGLGVLAGSYAMRSITKRPIA